MGCVHVAGCLPSGLGLKIRTCVGLGGLERRLNEQMLLSGLGPQGRSGDAYAGQGLSPAALAQLNYPASLQACSSVPQSLIDVNLCRVSAFSFQPVRTINAA